VKAADAHLYARSAQRFCDVHGARILVGLNADQRHEAVAAAFADLADDALRPDAGIGLVARGDADLDVLAEHFAPGAVEREPVQRRQGIGRDERTKPLDDVTVVVVVGGLDQKQMEALAHSASPLP
jgi:hypothetical protein